MPAGANDRKWSKEYIRLLGTHCKFNRCVVLGYFVLQMAQLCEEYHPAGKIIRLSPSPTKMGRLAEQTKPPASF